MSESNLNFQSAFLNEKTAKEIWKKSLWTFISLFSQKEDIFHNKDLFCGAGPKLGAKLHILQIPAYVNRMVSQLEIHDEIIRKLANFQIRSRNQ